MKGVERPKAVRWRAHQGCLRTETSGCTKRSQKSKTRKSLGKATAVKGTAELYGTTKGTERPRKVQGPPWGARETLAGPGPCSCLCLPSLWVLHGADSNATDVPLPLGSAWLETVPGQCLCPRTAPLSPGAQAHSPSGETDPQRRRQAWEQQASKATCPDPPSLPRPFPLAG